MSPDASLLFRGSLTSADSQSPVRRSAISLSVSGVAVADTGGLQELHTDPPPTREKNRCGPGASQREQIVIDGAYPARESERNK